MLNSLRHSRTPKGQRRRPERHGSWKVISCSSGSLPPIPVDTDSLAHELRVLERAERELLLVESSCWTSKDVSMLPVFAPEELRRGPDMAKCD